MNIKDLKYLVTIAEMNHFGRAAEACFVSQPALSMQIKKLENHLGVKLLERTNKSVMLTDAGAQIAARANDILHQVKELRELANAAKDPFSGEFKLGVIPTIAPYLLPHIMPALAKKYPKLSLYLIEEQTDLLVEKLKQGKLHAAILALPVMEKNFSSTILFEEEFFLAVPAKHPVAKLKKITQNDLRGNDLLLLEEGHCLREQALAVCHLQRAKELQDFRATSLETLRHMVGAGVGMTLMPKLACTTNKSIAYIPFTQPKPSRTVGLVWRTTSARQALLQGMAELIKSQLN